MNARSGTMYTPTLIRVVWPRPSVEPLWPPLVPLIGIADHEEEIWRGKRSRGGKMV